MTKPEWTQWEEARCPVCGMLYSYVKGEYKPSTCSNFDCLHKYIHSSKLKEKGVIEANKKD